MKSFLFLTIIIKRHGEYTFRPNDAAQLPQHETERFLFQPRRTMQRPRPGQRRDCQKNGGRRIRIQRNPK